MTFKKGVQPDGSWWVYAGDRNRVRWEFTGAAPVDLTGTVITAQARKADTDPLPALVALVEMTDPAGGLVHISWDGDDVRALLAGASSWEGEYDIQVLPPGQALPDTVHRAVMRAQMDVTREVGP
jgi:hypothetical protein